jgi:uncharacterized membrane protein YphA (DoxX/SURF4 family)
MVPFVGAVEVVFGLARLLGLLTRLSAFPLLIVILVAIATTNFSCSPELVSGQLRTTDAQTTPC